MIQFSIFHSLAESNINSLVQLLNEGLKDKEKYKLLFVEDLPEGNILLTASNEKNYIFNIVNQEGLIPNGFVVNWRSSVNILEEFVNEIPEPVVIARVLEVNRKLRDKGYNWDDIDVFWADVLKKANRDDTQKSTKTEIS